MASYEYQCSNGHKFVIIENIRNNHKPPTNCRQCKEPMTRVFGAPAIQFRGTGWGSGR
jgi:putative FmdB family regulatory protein